MTDSHFTKYEQNDQSILEMWDINNDIGNTVIHIFGKGMNHVFPDL